jgi:hypothetical protein
MLGGSVLWHARIMIGFGSPNLTFSESKWESQSNERPLLANYTCKIAHWKAIMNSLKYVPPIECIQYPNWLHQFSQLIRCVVFLGLKLEKNKTPYAKKFQIILYSWGFHDNNIFFLHLAPPFVSQNSQTMAILAKILRDTRQSETIKKHFP